MKTSLHDRLDLTIVSLVLVIELLGLFLLGVFIVHRFNEEERSQRSEAIARPAALLEQGALSIEAFNQRPLLEALVGPELDDAMIIRADGTVLASPVRDRIGRNWRELPDGAPHAGVSLQPGMPTTLRDDTGAGLVALRATQSPSAAEQEIFSYVRLRTDQTDARRSSLILALILLAAAAMGATAAVLVPAVRILIIRRLRALSRAVEKITRGDYTAAAENGGRSDEIAALSTGINAMTDRLHEKFAAMQSAIDELKVTRDHYETVVENAAEAIFVVQNAKFVFFNRRLAEILETSRDAITGFRVFDYVHPDDRALVEDRYARRMRGEAVPFSYEFRCVSTRGRIVWVRLHVVLIEWNGAPATLNYLEDITVRKNNEIALHKNRELLRATGSLTKVGGWELDLVTNTLTWTDQVRTIHEVEADYVPTVDSAIEFYTPESRPIIREAVTRVIEQGEPFDLELEIRTAKGRLVPVRALGDAQREDDRIVRVVGAFQDITEIKHIEQERENLERQLTQAQRLESIGRLAGGVAHDFNNMLQSISGNVALALEEIPKTHPARAFLEEIADSSKRSSELTRQLLAFARRQAAVPQVVNLGELLTTSVNMLGRLIGENIEIRLRPDADLWHVEIDPSQVDQILTNLCVNAADSIEGAGTITLETRNVTLDPSITDSHADAAPGDYVMLAVSDTGQGMDRETRLRIFEPFFTTKPQGKGTGLGLATVFGIVKQNRGIIDVHSEPGHGTTFRIYLPRAKKEAPTPQPKEAPQAGFGTETILFVEDEEQVLRLGERILRRHGYHVIPAHTPAEALEVVRHIGGGIDLLITDIIMPGINGRELYQKLLETQPQLRCLFISGYTADIISQHGILDAGVEFMEKPFSVKDLVGRVRKLLDLRRAADDRAPGAT